MMSFDLSLSKQMSILEKKPRLYTLSLFQGTCRVDVAVPPALSLGPGIPAELA